MSIPVANYGITTAEIPGKTTFFLEIGNCLQNCPGCHSPHLSKEDSPYLDAFMVEQLIASHLRQYPDVNAVLLMGGTTNKGVTLSELKGIIARTYCNFGVPCGLYSGRDERLLDFVDWAGLYWLKTGSYVEAKGGLESPATNQRFYEKQIVVETDHNGVYVGKTYRFHDITDKFQRRKEV